MSPPSSIWFPEPVIPSSTLLLPASVPSPFTWALCIVFRNHCHGSGDCLVLLYNSSSLHLVPVHTVFHAGHSVDRDGVIDACTSYWLNQRLLLTGTSSPTEERNIKLCSILYGYSSASCVFLLNNFNEMSAEQLHRSTFVSIMCDFAYRGKHK